MASNHSLRGIIKKALKQYQSFPLSGTLALTVSILLVQLALYALVFVIDLKNFGSRDFIVLQKPSGLLNQARGFNTSELKELESNGAVIKAFPVSRAKGEVFASVELGREKFGTLLFIESVSDEAVPGFSKKNNDYLEVIIGQSFLFLYNTTFAQAMGFPQVDASVLSFVPLKIEFRGPQKTLTMNARVIGTTDRIDSILISQSALLNINKEIYGQVPDSSKVLLNVVDKNAKDLKTLVKEGNFQTLDQNFSNSVVADVVQNALIFILVSGLILLLAALSVFISQSHIIQFRSAKDQILLSRYKVSSSVVRSVLLFSLFGALRLATIIGIITNTILWILTSKYFDSSLGFATSLLALGLIYYLINSRIQKRPRNPRPHHLQS